MSKKNMIEHNQYIFDSLKMRLESDPDIALRKTFNGRRHINTKDEEKSWLKGLALRDQQPLIGYFQGAIYEYQEEKYFAYVGDNLDVDIENFEFIELNAGIFTALASQLKIQITGNPLEIFNVVFFQDFEDDGKKDTLEEWSYDWILIKDFFPPFCLFKICNKSPFLSEDDGEVDISRVMAYFFIKARKHLILDMNDQTLHEYEKLIFEGSKYIPFNNVLLSLIAYQWKYSFLEVYRCIEQLFSMVMLKQIHQRIGKSVKDITLFQLATWMEDDLGWRPKEDNAIEEIIRQSPGEIISLFDNSKKDTDYEHQSVGTFLYKIRNAIVHFRALKEGEINLDNSKWNSLLQATLRLTKYWYSEYENYQKA